MCKLNTTIEDLDLATVLNVSLAVSGEIVLEKLVETLLRTAIEHAGAERGLLILSRGDELSVEAEASTVGDTVTVRLRDGPVAGSELPESVVQYAARTRESVILGDASVPGPFSGDAYVRERHARSVFCLPLVKQDRLVALLYLENSLAPHVFTPARTATLKVLASQAAISLENSRLYRELVERERQFRRVVDANTIAIFTWDVEGGRIADANDAFLQIIGYEREDIRQGRLRWTDLTPPEILKYELEVLTPQYKLTGHLAPLEKEFFHKDGHRVPVLIGVAPFDDEFSRGMAFIADLTEQKRAEEALRSSEAYLAEAQKLSKTGSWAASLDQDIRYWSEECYRVLSFDPQDGLPRLEQFFQRIHPDDRPGFRALIETVTREKTEWKADYRIVDPGGAVRHIHVVGHPVLSTSNDLVEFVGTVIDVTDRKRAQEDLRTSELERERAEQALRDAREKLAQASKIASLAELSASIAHEINQPLQAIVANGHASLRWLDTTPPNIGKARRTAERVVRDGNAAAEVVSRIRALFKHAAPAKVDLDINKLIVQVCTLMAEEIQRNGVSLETELGEDLPGIRADAVQIQQAIVNLVRNAIEAMDGAQRKPLLIRSRRSAGHVVVDVRDQGADLVDPAKIFEPFVSTKKTGMGMGLTICRSIMEAHGGDIGVVHNEGPGVTFSFSLPVNASDAT